MEITVISEKGFCSIFNDRGVLKYKTINPMAKSVNEEREAALEAYRSGYSYSRVNGIDPVCDGDLFRIDICLQVGNSGEVSWRGVDKVRCYMDQVRIVDGICMFPFVLQEFSPRLCTRVKTLLWARIDFITNEDFVLRSQKSYFKIQVEDGIVNLVCFSNDDQNRVEFPLNNICAIS